jgi:septum site-determining protein MinC
MIDDRQGYGRARVQIRGTRDGMVIELPEGPSALDLIQDLQDDLRDAGNFFRRGELIIDFGTRPPDLEEISAFDAILRERGIRLRTVTAGTEESRNILQSWGFRQPRPRFGSTWQNPDHTD